jgi:hypothetical protein
MLVAVAAMAFTACQNDNNEVNEVAKKTVISGVLSFDEETRSGFAGKNEAGYAYVSEWDGGETIKIYIDGCGSVFTQVDEEGRFEVAVDGEISSGTAMYVCSPADAWNSQWTPTIPTDQTPRANSVDPAAHILQSIGATVASSMITMSPQQACYGKMTVNAPDFEIAKVEVSFNGGQVYTINAKNVENNVFWFAVDSMIDVATFTVTAYDTENNAITKTVDVAAAGKTLKFQWGHVSTFSVSDLEAVVAPEEPKALVFTSAKWVNTSYSDKLVQFYTEDGGTLQLNWYKCGSDAWIVPNTYGFASSGAIYGGGEFSWYKNSAAGIDTEIVDGTVIVSVVDGQYYIEFKNLADYSAVQIESATFTGQISGLQVPDMRTILAAPTATATVDGNVITISWNEVTGADEYYVSCTTGGLDAITTTETSVTIEAEYSTKYDFSIKAVANDSNPDYKTSGVYNFSITTGENPNVEYISLTSMSEGVYEGSSWNYRFTFKGDNSEFILAWPDTKATSTNISSGDYAYNSNYSALYGFGNAFGANNTYKFDGINAKINGGTIKVSSEGNIYTITMKLSLNSGDEKLFKYVGEIGATSEPDPTPDPDQPGDGEESGVTIKYIKNYGSGYTHLRYYELTSGNDVIGFWMNNSNSSNTVMSNGTYKNNSGGLNKVVSSSTTIYIDKNVIDGENKSGVQNTSQMVVSNNGGHVEFKLEYWDNSLSAFVVKEYVFDGTIQQ